MIKKILTIVFLIGAIGTSMAQSNTFPSSGNVGIGTTSPGAKLEVVAPAISGQEQIVKFRVADEANDYLRIMNGTGISGQFIPSISSVFSSDNRTGFYISSEIHPSNDNGSNAVFAFVARTASAPVVNRNLFTWNNHASPVMVLGPTGNLGLGTTSPSSKLEVNGTIKTKEVNVTTSGWADYVFKPNYDLMSLQEVEKYISDNGHLPNVPSEKEVLEYGVNLLEMNIKLLEKVEELTLYLLKQQKEIDQLKVALERKD